MSKGPTKDRDAVRRLEDALIDDILGATDDEIAAEAAEDGIDLEAQAAVMRSMLERARLESGKTRMAAAKAAAAAHRSVAPHGRIPVSQSAGFAGRAANDVGNARKLTMAARNGGEQLDRDLKGVEEDLAELNALIEEEGKES
ncbi:hypothetical protein [Roseomonas sp. USHLN139]|uniref:hypothetical protein n=1 Tax=Roseomonas sp. USHLN139 TaxID=3081298 RepID=UPI003B02594A